MDFTFHCHPSVHTIPSELSYSLKPLSVAGGKEKSIMSQIYRVQFLEPREFSLPCTTYLVTWRQNKQNPGESLGGNQRATRAAYLSRSPKGESIFLVLPASGGCLPSLVHGFFPLSQPAKASGVPSYALNISYFFFCLYISLNCSSAFRSLHVWNESTQNNISKSHLQIPFCLVR